MELLNTFRAPAQMRLIFDEFFYYQLALALRRQKEHHARGIAMRVREEKIRDALKRMLPFKPTAAQKRVLAEIAGDLERPYPMHRMLEGDVGSGKTIVALEAATIAIENGYQVALMAPTEILAAQHFLSARSIFEPLGYHVELVVSGRKKAEKEGAIERIGSGEAQFVVGTHALIENPVTFKKLGLVIVDEQHRFGVLQRKRLIEKGAAPHVLVMTATPIPRTLALTLYGDLDLSVIDEMPPGRTPIETRWTSDDRLAGVWEFLRREIAKGHQAYVIYPVIEESKQELKAATAEYERLAKTVFPNLKVGLLHGRLKNEEKESVMEQFRGGQIADSGRDYGNRSWRGRAERDGDGDRTCRALRARAASPASRAHRTRKRKIVLHSGRAEIHRGRRQGAHRDDGRNIQRIRNRRARPEAARPGRIFRHAPAW